MTKNKNGTENGTEKLPIRVYSRSNKPPIRQSAVSADMKKYTNLGTSLGTGDVVEKMLQDIICVLQDCCEVPVVCCKKKVDSSETSLFSVILMMK